MNRNISGSSDSFSTKLNHAIGEQPRKLMSSKSKKMSRFEYDSDDIEFDRHRQNYKRAAAKFSTRIQLNSNEINF
ncbi:MAG: hypothetical protein EOO52_01210 [Gammaproteobacteria bacterium]|nr:MAG: hypothetical protein EOO52_01210 [Gammaproteobacteria bacterium]